MSEEARTLKSLIEQEIDFFLTVHPRGSSICLTVGSEYMLDEDTFLTSLLLFVQQANDLKLANEGNHVIFDTLDLHKEH